MAQVLETRLVSPSIALVAEPPAQELTELRSLREALESSYAIIEFSTEGEILSANKNFLDVMQYRSNEIIGKHHRMFVLPEDAAGSEYQQFWIKLKSGQAFSNDFRRVKKDGSIVWIRATYTPLKVDGRVTKVTKLAQDITRAKSIANDSASQLQAIGRSQAVIEFDLDCRVVSANENFQKTMGYTLAELIGKQHREFVTREEAESTQYKAFWNSLRRGTFEAGLFKRISKQGNEVWIQATYNPIINLEGKVYKVVKFATDVTEHVKAQGRTEAIRQVVAQTVGEMNHTIREVSRRVQDTATLATRAETLAKATEQKTQHLDRSSKTIGDVVGVIGDIARQTNLLALNATIEAARAGNAGQGFAVVASEVKRLADQTSHSLSEISRNVSSIQTSVVDVIKGSREINHAISEVSANTTTVASAIEEQSVTMANLNKTAEGMVTVPRE